MILVTGGTGLIGSHLLYQLCKQGKKVRALKRSSSNINLTQKLFRHYSTESPSLFNQVQWVDGDVEDYQSLIDALQGVDEVYHCAAMVSFAKRDIQRMLEVNVGGTANMVDAALEVSVKRFCHVSSVASLGAPVRGNEVTEESIWGKSKGKSGYAVSKFRSEMEVWRGIELGLNATMVNPSVIVGPGRWDSGSGQIFGTLAKGFPFYTTGITGYVDVRDVVDSMVSAMDKQLWGRRFIINGENISHQKVFELIAKANGHKPPTIEVKPWMTAIAWRGAWLVGLITHKSPAITRDTANSGHSTTFYSSQRMKSELGVTPRTIAEAVRNTVKAGSF
ncbi:SDR family NAD(P)-dependent oxidoreductase [Perlabentimonas gracilis]|uniref:SDR family NAD(P)-dependent oxidoreductase n=1 Tax=Perlabentimonas gracilis TaxID=2715279 RepID=UPI0014078955|nr:SDR family NAD(P)-dependent oxidoreductase [Perlabentimonas gracilis]NHB69044.1 SDR family NAD(P)-dependent oxidoreductase [Perlabentimonas gracilis]